MVRNEIKDGIKKIKNRIGSIKNKIRRGKSADPGGKRERSACPECGSVAIKKRTKYKEGYICTRCGWKGKNVSRVEWPKDKG